MPSYNVYQDIIKQYLFDLFLTGNALINIFMCVSFFFLWVLTWPFSMTHRILGGLLTTSMIFFSFILYYAPTQYFWFRAMPSFFIAANTLYNTLYFWPYRKLIYEAVLDGMKTMNIHQRFLLTETPHKFEVIPKWLAIPALLAMVAVSFVLVNVLKRADDLVAEKHSQAQQEKKRADSEAYNTRLLTDIVKEQQQLRAANVKLIAQMQADKTSDDKVVAKAAEVAKAQAMRLYRNNMNRIEVLERQRLKEIKVKLITPDQGDIKVPTVPSGKKIIGLVTVASDSLLTPEGLSLSGVTYRMLIDTSLTARVGGQEGPDPIPEPRNQ